MKNWKNKLVPMLWVLASVGFLVRPVKQLIKEEPLDATDFVLAGVFLVFLVIGIAVGRKSGGGKVA